MADKIGQVSAKRVFQALKLVAAQRHEIVLTTDGMPVEEAPMENSEDEDSAALMRSRLQPKPPSAEATAKFVGYGNVRYLFICPR